MSVTSAAPKLPESFCLTRNRSLPRRSLTSGSIAAFFDVRLKLFPKHIRDGRWRELSLFYRHQHIFASGDDHIRILFSVHLEIEVDRAAPDLSEECFHDQQLVERDRMKKIAFDMHAREPDAEVFEKRTVRKAA